MVNGRLWGMPIAFDEGVHCPITIKIHDHAGASDSEVFSIEVKK